MSIDKHIQAFFALLRAGLWEKEVRLSAFEPVDFEGLFRLASQQSVVGLVTAGLEHVTDAKVTREAVMAFMSSALSMEQRNLAMNAFIAKLFRRMEEAGIKALLVKGQGMPAEAMPFYCSSALNQWKARRILAFVLETGNFGHNKDVSYMKKYPYVIRKAISLWRHTWDFVRQFFVFPLDSMRAWRTMIKEGFGAVAKEK